MSKDLEELMDPTRYLEEKHPGVENSRTKAGVLLVYSRNHKEASVNLAECVMQSGRRRN